MLKIRRAYSNCRIGVFLTRAIAHHAQGIIIAPGEARCHLGYQPVGLNNAGLGLSAGVAEPGELFWKDRVPLSGIALLNIRRGGHLCPPRNALAVGRAISGAKAYCSYHPCLGNARSAREFRNCPNKVLCHQLQVRYGNVADVTNIGCQQIIAG